MAEPPFPPEIEREIFETTALKYPNFAPTMLRVAWHVHAWIEPLLYRVLVIDSEPIALALISAMSRKSPEFFHNAVHHIAVPLDSSTGVPNRLFSPLEQVISLCTGVRSFGCMDAFLNPRFIPIFTGMHDLRRLSCCLEVLFDTLIDKENSIDLTLPFFNTLTHLECFDFRPNSCVFIQKLLRLPKLTHLGIPEEYLRTAEQDGLFATLAECPRIRILLFQYDGSPRAYEAMKQPHIYDPRVVLVVSCGWDDWKAEARGALRYWAEADDFVARKRSGEGDIETTRFWIHEDAAGSTPKHVNVFTL
ncbi:tyrosinase central domain-containing protein [Favolaschia claudopus]|uniref:Tyrosinase central domain-containing protein n=1 Tax=Favolaschia claudopus TaxID=2862362 RepID=A0AAW0DH03_9AGAR